MEFKDNANIYTSDEKEAGRLHRVVIDPDTKEVTHIVLQKGLFFKEDRVISVEKIASASHDKVTLNCTADELKEMAPLTVEQYDQLDETSGRSLEYPALMDRMYWLERSIITESKRTIPDNLVALKEGARVISENDDHVGNVERVLTDPDTGKVTGFVLSEGLLFKTRKVVPVEWVKLTGEDEVHLTVKAQQLEELPEWNQETSLE